MKQELVSLFQDGGRYPVQIVMADTAMTEQNREDSSVQASEDQLTNRFRARSLTPSMEMLDQKRLPKPKQPMGNDIGTARVLNPFVRRLPNGYTKDISSQPHTTDHLEATVSVGFTMSTTNATQPRKDEESAVVSRELHDIMDAVPTLPALHIPHLQFHRDPEEEAINQRITEVARQLAESAMRKEYEEGKLGQVFPLPSGKPQMPILQTGVTSVRTQAKTVDIIASTKASDQEQEKIVADSETPAIPQVRQNPGKAVVKLGKSFAVSNSLPLVSHMPQEAAQLQLIAEVQQVPHFMVHEGFQPRTPSPELSGPVLGGPPLNPEDSDEQRTSKSIDITKSEPNTPLLAMRLPAFLKFVSPKYGFKPNDLVVSIPVGGGFIPAVVSQADGWWPGPIFKQSNHQVVGVQKRDVPQHVLREI